MEVQEQIEMGGLAHHANVTATTMSTSKRQSRQPPIGQIIPPPRLLAMGIIVEQEQNPVPMATNVALAIAHPRIKATFALQVKTDKYSV